MKRGVIWLGVAVVGLAGLLALLFIGLPYYLAPQDTVTKADVIVAISGGETNSRVAGAVKIYKDGYAPNIIFSGAAQDPNSISNAAAMRKIALAAGVPRGAVDVEEDSVDTHENAQNVARLIRDAGYKSMILVTSPYHQRRASIEFKRALGKDFVIINHSTSDENWRRSAWWKNNYSLTLTLSELQKIIFLYISKPQNQS